jgi:acyl carrier protein
MENQQKALGIIANILNVDVGNLALETVIQEVSDWDSLVFLTIVTELSDEFKLEIPIEQVMELANANTIGEFLSLFGI